jgi:hypothetical protein
MDRGRPKDVLATNFGEPAEVFGKFPDRDLCIAGKERAPWGRAAH